MIRAVQDCVGGAKIAKVLGREPFGGSVVIRVGEPKEGRVHGFGYGLAEVLSIELDQP